MLKDCANGCRSRLPQEDGHIDAFYYCPNLPDAPLETWRRDHEDRKPRPGMLTKALKEFPTDIGSSFMIGDKTSDMEAASAAGISGFLFAGGRIDRFVVSILDLR